MKQKHTLHDQHGRGHELPAERILCNDIFIPEIDRFNPHSVRLWLIGNEYGALAACWASCEQDAMDEAFDAGLLESFEVSEEDVAKSTDDEREGWVALGNAGEYCNLDYAWIEPVTLDRSRDFELLMAFAYAKGDCSDTLDF